MSLGACESTHLLAPARAAGTPPDNPRIRLRSDSRLMSPARRGSLTCPVSLTGSCDGPRLAAPREQRALPGLPAWTTHRCQFVSLAQPWSGTCCPATPRPRHALPLFAAFVQWESLPCASRSLPLGLR